MDPTTTLVNILTMLATQDPTDVHAIEEAALALADWLGRGGYFPNVTEAVAAAGIVTP